jgi:hypothetical protein
MCIDYTSLNKACPKDEYLLPHICQIVDSKISFELLSFVDTYSGYHQIGLTIDDKEKITFITPFRILCYTKMVFRLKNEGSTYQKCIQIILEPQIGRNLEAYTNDVVVKLKRRGDLLDDLKETFDNLRKYKMMLNPKKIYVWYIIRETALLHGFTSRNWCEPKEGGGHRTIATTTNSQGNPEAGSYDGGTQLVHIQVGWMWYALLQATK